MMTIEVFSIFIAAYFNLSQATVYAPAAIKKPTVARMSKKSMDSPLPAKPKSSPRRRAKADIW
jgi:hypothetical protein